jgi:hypothetical protein
MNFVSFVLTPGPSQAELERGDDNPVFSNIVSISTINTPDKLLQKQIEV